MEGFRNPHIDWAALAPVLVLLGASALVLVVGVFLPRRARRGFAGLVAAAGFLGAAVACGLLWNLDEQGRAVVAEAIRRDRLAEIAQILLCGAGLLAVGASWWEARAPRGEGAPADLLDDRERTAEYYALLLAAVAGMAFFVQASNLMTLFLGLEWFSIALYVLTAVAVHRLGSLEAGLKYLIVGSFGSAILLFGCALVYGATGELGFSAIAGEVPNAERLFLLAGLAMILVGLAFKVSAAPFHMWTPDVYQGAPTPVSAFMSAATKVAALVLTLRLLVTAFPSEQELWTTALAVIACVSLAWGNLAAIVQSDVKRLLAYSSVSHAGFLLMPIAAGNALGGRALLYYLIPYCALSIGSFAVVAARERELARPVAVADLAGFGWERPFHGLAMAAFMFGFIGFPSAGILLGKLYVFSAVIERGWTWLAIVGVAATVVSVYYYAGVVRAMYMTPPAVRVAPAGGSPPRDAPLTATVLVCLVVGLGSLLAADPVIELMRDSVAFLDFPL
ncbi:MAG: NADH-quinone oxidoreductase subunit N [Thermoleophilia bacterium]|nr:NADH-quinone oxidoreductase subunit N [Thermoleophilia bacterium]